MLTFDRNATLNLALVAEFDFSRAHYEPLDEAPATTAPYAPRAYLRQMHAVANGVICGVVANQRVTLVPAQWERLSSVPFQK